ncbi:glutathione amide-dependent peroxidase [Thiohalobacter sp. COW1]|uniref:glutathione peroxidase n=1 Tax=Thiohalobacter sp. COW1 TaxID=2795687 RepID=UPI001914E195|nr:glutathione peroxidase [Thiohalobacter sp. COW1]BCO32133.1 glutathione amide-dependent peroxidase [Thiohalobacter sp. COW1]
MLQDKTGSRIPNITFHTRQNNEWADVTTDEIFKGRNVVVFSLPGAFTPTCSSAHVPRFNELAPVLRDNGIDEIVCVSVNDTFVMNEWAKDQQAENIRFIPDGNGEFTAAMGMLVDKDDLGFGKRSWRYSMLVRDGVIEKMFIEPEVPGDPYEVSDADTMLDYINPQAVKPHDVVLFTKPGCPWCARAKGMLSEAGMEFDEISVGEQVSLRAVRAASGSDTVPQVWIDGVHIGDSEALAEWMQRREAA